MQDQIINDPRLPRASWSVQWHWFWFSDTWKALLGRLYPNRIAVRWWLVGYQFRPHRSRCANVQLTWWGPVHVVIPRPWLPGPARAHIELCYGADDKALCST